jgi:hypothetical protein
MKGDACLIALAYPDFYIVPEKRWYMHVFKAMGMVRDGKISAGHAGLILIRKSDGYIQYTDFGRYYTPVGKGRVRCEKNDPELKIDLIAKFNSKGKLTNLDEILNFFEAHDEITEGVGPMFASLNENIIYENAINYIHYLADLGSIPYNLTQKKSSNCARFVADTLNASTFDNRVLYKIKNHYKPFISPLANVYSNAAEQRPIYKVEAGKQEEILENGIKIILKYLWFNSPNEQNSKYASQAGAFKEPDRSGLPDAAQWLGGFADGTWFELADQSKNEYYIKRYASNKNLIFAKRFKAKNTKLNLGIPYQFTYDSHAQKCSLIQNDNRFLLETVD